jgi:hypothetical protein
MIGVKRIAARALKMSWIVGSRFSRLTIVLSLRWTILTSGAGHQDRSPLACGDGISAIAFMMWIYPSGVDLWTEPWLLK